MLQMLNRDFEKAEEDPESGMVEEDLNLSSVTVDDKKS